MTVAHVKCIHQAGSHVSQCQSNAGAEAMSTLPHKDGMRWIMLCWTLGLSNLQPYHLQGWNGS